MKVRVLSKKKSGSEVFSGLIDEQVAGKVLELLLKYCPDEKHRIVRSDRSIVREKRESYQKGSV